METRIRNVMVCVMLLVLFTMHNIQAEYILIDKPGASRTYPNGIDGDTVVGYYDNSQGFIYSISGNSWENFALDDDSTSYASIPYNIEDGYIVGCYADGGQTYIGFVYEIATGEWDTLNFAYETIAFDTDGDYVVGNYGTPGSYQGFVYEISTGNWNSLNFSSEAVLTYLTGIDTDAGTGGIIVASGKVGGLSAPDESWLYDMGSGQWTQFFGPDGEEEVFLFGIDGNYITGVYGTGQQAFLYDRVADLWTLLDVEDSVGTFPQGIDGSTVVGYFNNPGSPGHGFIFYNPDPAELVEDLVCLVIAVNSENGIQNSSLEAKLNAALNTLNDINDNNNVAAINTLGNFIDTVIKQRDRGDIPTESAQELIDAAQYIIDLLTNG